MFDDNADVFNNTDKSTNSSTPQLIEINILINHYIEFITEWFYIWGLYVQINKPNLKAENAKEMNQLHILLSHGANKSIKIKSIFSHRAQHYIHTHASDARDRQTL